MKTTPGETSFDEASLDAVKTALNIRVKASLRADLRAKSWEEKIASIARMNAAAKIAQAAMRQAMAEQAETTKSK